MNQETSNSVPGDHGDGKTGPGTSKPPQEWVSGDEPATDAQMSYLRTLARDAGEVPPASLSKARASQLIDGYRRRSARIQD